MIRESRNMSLVPYLIPESSRTMATFFTVKFTYKLFSKSKRYRRTIDEIL